MWPVFPRQGMMCDGRVYQLPRLARTIAANASSCSRGDGTKETVNKVMWPTPRSYDAQPFHRMFLNLTTAVHSNLYSGWQPGNGASSRIGLLNPEWVEWLMGFPKGWTRCSPACTR